MYVVYDSKAQVYNKPFYFINHQVAIRACRELLSDPNNEISRHPEDFAMFHVGTYDDLHAHIKLAKTQECIVRFHELAAIMPSRLNETAPSTTPINPENAHTNMEIAS
jgi:hypothetical protein